MAQSDSSDFAFDISNLEVEGSEPATSEQGDDVSSDEGAPEVDPVSEASGEDKVPAAAEPDADSELSGFDIDALPDPYSAASLAEAERQAAAAVEGEADESDQLRRMEDEPAPRSMRELGEEDLGADVFEEIESDGPSMTFEDALDDLLEEVDEFEAGGFIDLDAEDESALADAASSEAADIFKLNDPDDSLQKSVDPNAEPRQKPRPAAQHPVQKEAPSQNPGEIEIPADPIEPELLDETEVEQADALDEQEQEDASDAVSAAGEKLDEAAVQEDSVDPLLEEDEDLADLESSLEDLESDAADSAAEIASDSEDVDDVHAEEELNLEELDEDAPVEVEAVDDQSEESLEGTSDEDGEQEDFSSLSEAVEEEESQLEDEDPASEGESEPEDEELAEAAVPGLEEAPEEDEDLAELVESLDEEDYEEEPASPDVEPIGDGDDGSAAEAEVEVVEDEDEESLTAMPSAEDLLKQAGGLLNGDKPAAAASAMLDGLGGEDAEDEEEIEMMPSPQDLIAEAAPEEDEDGLAAMPDPLSMMREAAGEKAPPAEDSEEEPDDAAPKPVSGNVADRAGDLPPPPPAPVEIIDEDPLEEDLEAPPEPSMDVLDDDEAGDLEEDDSLKDPFASEISLDDFDDELLGPDGIEDILLDDGDLVVPEKKQERSPVATLVQAPKRSLLWRVTHSMAIAAGLVLLGVGSILAVWKQQIIEYIDGRDIDGSALVAQIRAIGSYALGDLGEDGLYRMQWVDSEVRQVAKNEIRLYAVIGAQLREDLYKPVLESELVEKFGYDDQELVEALLYAEGNLPEDAATFPTKPWDTLYRISASKDQVVPLRVTYKLTREDERSDWELSGVRVRGYEEELVWPEGDPKFSFGERAYDVDSPEFARLFYDFESRSQGYIAQVSALKNSSAEKLASLHRENEERRERVMTAMSQGAFFSGVAILGEDAAHAKDVRMVITEIREKGALVKGVFQFAESDRELSKQFIGSVDFETTLSGSQQGVLNLTTVSIDSPEAHAATSPFFKPSTTSRIRLKTDGFRLEGDIPDLSLRLTRSM